MEKVKDLILRIDYAILNPLILLLFALALLYFIWGVFIFIKNSDSDEGRETGKRHIVWGIVGLAIMVSVWGIIGVIRNTLEDIPNDNSAPNDELPVYDA